MWICDLWRETEGQARSGHLLSPSGLCLFPTPRLSFWKEFCSVKSTISSLAFSSTSQHCIPLPVPSSLPALPMNVLWTREPGEHFMNKFSSPLPSSCGPFLLSLGSVPQSVAAFVLPLHTLLSPPTVTHPPLALETRLPSWCHGWLGWLSVHLTSHRLCSPPSHIGSCS